MNKAFDVEKARIEIASMGFSCHSKAAEYIAVAALRYRQPEIDELRRDNAALQSKIDALMLEYCPSEMSKEQIEEWGRNQCAVDVKFTG